MNLDMTPQQALEICQALLKEGLMAVACNYTADRTSVQRIMVMYDDPDAIGMHKRVDKAIAHIHRKGFRLMTLPSILSGDGIIDIVKHPSNVPLAIDDPTYKPRPMPWLLPGMPEDTSG